jgi:hypothetical protein
MTGLGSIIPAEALRDIDPRRALLVVTCSAAKARGGQPPSAANDVTPWPEALSAARARVLATAEADTSAVLPAWRRYTGTFYQHARPRTGQRRSGWPPDHHQRRLRHRPR